MRTRRVLRTSIVALAAAGSCFSTAPDAALRARVVVTTRLAGNPAMFVQDLDGGNRTRLFLQNVADNIPGNLPEVVVRDDRLLALGTPTWNSDGSRIAVVASVTFDQSEIVVMDADGEQPEVGSANTQIIFSRPVWSRDGSSLAYAMSTFSSGLVDVFVTEPATHTVKRVTSGANLKDAGLQWSLAQPVLYLSKRTGEADDGRGNSMFDIVSVNLATGEQTPLRTSVVGDVQAISRSGTSSLLRNRERVGSDYLRDLIQLNVTGDLGERTLISRERILYAVPAATDGYAIIVSAASDGGQRFELLNLSSGVRTPVGGVGSESNIDVIVTPAR